MAVSEFLLLVLLMHFTAGQDANCDFTQNVQAGQTYYIYSPGYPNYYTGARQCRWIGICPSGYRCRLDCPEISLPASSGCSMDRLLISRSGDPQLNGADVYCGRGSTNVLSTGQRISVGLITSASTTGGRFYCQLRAEAATPTPTPCSCGYRKRNRIVGGQETGVNEFPMMAGVIYLDQEKIRCGGTILSPRYIATAAHCVVGRSLNTLAVVVGEHDKTTDGDSSATQGFNIERVTVHPQYTSSNYDNDIAILRLSRDIVYSDRVGPVCLPFKFNNTDFAGSRFTLLGWGSLFIGGPVSNTLQKVDVDVLSQSSCQQVVSSLTPRQLCHYTAGKDACQDDSGGPALYSDPSTGLLFLGGIISYGRMCAERGQPGINTRVTAHLAWIQNNTPGAVYCNK
ncbi:venom serine protease-like [Leguminivora glycinivorella]|uniref:venom serine protease-like n=1 Tax=Leguminivora glycinivorella TaxID=1035111 RepID=UPI00200CF532|nr:venom serine protease-like [Leguminivora glycinivorella]XP_048000960.1 venom serine protease-like [Leguminivora glycinivorella]XP_048000961.1 venom serine protease-like [Leguminivora glycinivorella]